MRANASKTVEENATTYGHLQVFESCADPSILRALNPQSQHPARRRWSLGSDNGSIGQLVGNLRGCIRWWLNCPPIAQLPSHHRPDSILAQVRIRRKCSRTVRSFHVARTRVLWRVSIAEIKGGTGPRAATVRMSPRMRRAGVDAVPRTGVSL